MQQASLKQSNIRTVVWWLVLQQPCKFWFKLTALDMAAFYQHPHAGCPRRLSLPRYQSWYPIAALTSLQSNAPNAVYLLGTRMVIWQDKQGAWRCFEDLCPHRCRLDLVCLPSIKCSRSNCSIAVVVLVLAAKHGKAIAALVPISDIDIYLIVTAGLHRCLRVAYTSQVNFNAHIMAGRLMSMAAAPAYHRYLMKRHTPQHAAATGRASRPIPLRSANCVAARRKRAQLIRGCSEV